MSAAEDAAATAAMVALAVSVCVSDARGRCEHVVRGTRAGHSFRSGGIEQWFVAHAHEGVVSLGTDQTGTQPGWSAAAYSLPCVPVRSW